MYPSTTGTICILYKKGREKERKEGKKSQLHPSTYFCCATSSPSPRPHFPLPLLLLTYFHNPTTTPVTRPCEKRAMTAGLAMYSEGTSKASNISSHIFSRFCRVMSGSSVRSICKKKEKKRKEKKRKEKKRKENKRKQEKIR